MNMSQVKKFQAGGKFRMNGRELSGQKALDNLATAFAGSDPSERGMWNIAQKAIQDGNIAQYNTSDNSIQVFDDKGNDITGTYYQGKASTNDSGFKRFFDALGENESHRFKKSGRYMSLVNMNDTPESTPSNKTPLTRGSGWWEYTKDKSGKKVYIDGINNEERMGVLHNIRKYFDDEDRATLQDRYDTTGWKKSTLDTFTSMYDKVAPEERENYWKSLYDRIRGNVLTPADKQLLTAFGFTEPSATTTTSAQGSNTNAGQSTVPENWTGNKTLAQSNKLGIRKGDDGHYYIYGDNPYVSGTYYLKDYDWAAGTPFENGVAYNGRLYTQDEVFDTTSPNRDLAMQQAMKPFIDAWRDRNLSFLERWNKAKQSGVHWANEDNNIFQQIDKTGNPYTINPNEGWIENWSKYFRENGLGEGDYSIIDATDIFDTPEGQQVIAYINNKDYNFRNPYGIDNLRYMVRDGAGNITNYDSLDALTAGAGLSTNKSIYSTGRNIQYNPYQNINGSDYAEYRKFKTGNQENTLFVDRDGYLYWARRDQNGQLMAPKRVYDVNRMKEILANPDGIPDINKEYSKITLAPTGAFLGTNIPTWSFRVKQWQKNREQSKNPESFQWGGSIQSVKNNVTNSYVNDAVTDVSNMHAIDSSQGGLTDDEKKLIAAAAGDLVGVGLTFVPVYGNIAGAATGMASSLARFSTNKETGVKGSGWKLAGDLALDAASILPIIGTGAKAAKAASTIRAVAKPILKLLSITGAATPVMTAVQKIANGEKYTSADLAEAIRGVGSAVIAGNMISQSVGNAKLAAKKAAEAADIDANSIKRGSVALEGGKQYTDESTAKELEDLIQKNPTKQKAINAIIEKARGKDIILNESQAESILSQKGVEFENGKLNINPFKKGLLKRSPTNAVYKTPEVYSASRYYFSPRKRADILGSEAVYGFGRKQGILNKTSEEELNAAIKRLSSGFDYSTSSESKAADKALLRLSAYNPKLFGNLLKAGNVYRPVQDIRNKGELIFGGRRYYRIPAKTPEVPQPKEDFNSWFNNYLNSTMPIEPLRGMRSPYMVDMSLTQARNNPRGMEALQYLAFKQGGKIKKFASGGIWDAINVNKANINDLMRGVVGAKMIKSNLEDSLKSNAILKTRQFQTPILKGRAYDFSDIDRKYQLAKQPLLNTKLNSSDNFANLAGKLAVSENLSNLGLQQGAEESARISQTKDYNDQIDNQNTIARVQTANEKSNYLTQLEARDPMLRVEARNFLHSNILGPLGQQFGQQIRDAQNLDSQLSLEQRQNELSLAEQANLDAKFAPYKNAWLNSEERKMGADFEDYMTSDVERAKFYNETLAASRNNLAAAIASLKRQNVWNQGAGLFKVTRTGVYKSGGSVSVTVNNRNRSIRPTTEQIAVDSNRAAQKNAQKLSDNLARLLQQLLSK